MPPTLETPLDRLLDPIARCLTAEVARRLVEIRTDPITQARIDQLADKANQGILTPAELAEYQGFVEAIDIVSVLRAKAHKVLSEQDA